MIKKIHWLLVILVLNSGILHAQDSHYWSHQFGTRAALLSGAVVAGVSDNSMIYYNPGALGFLEENNVSINANLYEIENITIENALGQRVDFTSSQIGNVPLLISGMLSGEKRKWKIGYALVSPVAFSFKGSARLDDSADLIRTDESIGDEEYVLELNRDVKTTETMAGLGFSRKINEQWSLGFTHFFNIRSETYNNTELVFIFLNDARNTLISSTDIENVSYFNIRYQLKLGAAWKPNDTWSFGLTLTTPSINLFGNGTVAANIVAQNVKVATGERLDILASDRQSKLKSTYKSPLSVSAGVGYEHNKSKIGLSVQYFGGLDPYTILNAEPATFVRSPEIFGEFTSDEFLRVNTSAAPVFNVAVGYEYLLNENLSLSMSFRNDMSYYEEQEENGIQITMTNWDIWHTVIGTNITKTRSTLTVGLMPSFGNNNKFRTRGSLTSEDNLFSSATDIEKASYFSIGFLLGYTYNFRKF